jgi:threonine/homoserine/homoserine lactone efflux protein
LGYVTLATSVGALQPFVIMIYISTIGAFVPGALDEEPDRQTILLKISAVAFIVLGIHLAY